MVKAYQITLANKKQYLLTEEEGESIKSLLKEHKRQMVQAYDDMFPTSQIVNVSATTFNLSEASSVVKEHFTTADPPAPDPHWRKLPTATVLLLADEQYPEDISKAVFWVGTRGKLEREGKPYWVCECHYEKRDTDEYIIEPQKIKSATLCVPQEGESTVVLSMSYGVDRW